jgi:hypothetical protein
MSRPTTDTAATNAAKCVDRFANRLASLKRPLYGFMGDWAMYRDIWTGKIRF